MPGERILKIRSVLERVPMSRSLLYAEIRAGRFPRPIALGVKARGWRETDIDRYIESRSAAPRLESAK
jgi:prophage regulatory protein